MIYIYGCLNFNVMCRYNDLRNRQIGIIFQLFAQSNLNLHSIHETRPLVVPAKCTHRVDDSVYLLLSHSAHSFVEFVKVLFDCVIVHSVIPVSTQRHTGVHPGMLCAHKQCTGRKSV